MLFVWLIMASAPALLQVVPQPRPRKRQRHASQQAVKVSHDTNPPLCPRSHPIHVPLSNYRCSLSKSLLHTDVKRVHLFQQLHEAPLNTVKSRTQK